MKLRQTFATITFVLMTYFVVFAQSDQFSINNSPLPAPTGMVNDYANIIDDTVQAQIEQKLRDFKAKTNPSVEIAVVTVKTTGERPIFDYSLAVARGWKIGSKDDDNPSALLLIAVDDRKYFTQISKDLEDELTDGISGQLQRQYLVPAFKQGDYTKGVNDTIDAYIRTIEERKSSPNGTPTPAPKNAGSKSGISSGVVCCIIIVVVIVVIIIVISSIFGGGSGGSGGSGGGRDRWRSGGFGGNSRNSGYSSPIVIWGGGGGGGSSWGGSSGGGGGDSWG
ncbi:MAG TPA: TPM domain-containing protein, partial [Pyrinomonadaceae bacterium]|nr:TPM domain-containing protein [Pyrinomonadaceae bacterium]